MVLRLCAARVYDAVIVRMTATWYAAVLDRVEAEATQLSTERAKANTDSGVGAGDECRFHLLDVGIGTASALMTQAHRVAAMRLRVTGVDYDKAYVRAARAAVASNSLERLVNVHCLSVYEPQLRTAVLGDTGRTFVDGAYFSGSLTLMPDPLAALEAVAGLVRPGGHVYVTQTYQRHAVPLLSVVKPLLKYVTTIDFGPLLYERQLQDLVSAASRLPRPLLCEHMGPVAGSVDNWFQVAKLVVFKVGA